MHEQVKPEVDWEALRKYGTSEIECECGAVYRSRYKFVYALSPVSVTETACPSCGKDFGHVVRASSDPEYMTTGG